MTVLSSTEPQHGSGDAGALAVALAAFTGGREPGRLHKMVGAYVLASTTWRIGKRVWDRANSELTYTVAVPVDDDIYPDVHRWVLERMSPRQRRSLTARSRPASNTSPVIGEDVRPRALRLLYDGSRSQIVEVGGHKVRVNVETPGVPAGGEDVVVSWHKRERIAFTARGVQARDAVLRMLEELAAEERHQPRVFVATRWGDWQHTNDVPVRSLDSVVLDGDRKEQLVADLRSFLADEAEYARLGIPYHRGYLFRGPPGCGKTSIAKALANEFGMDVYYVSLSSIPNDNLLFQLLGNVKSRSLVLFEDIDIAHASRKRDDGEPGVTMGGLLNGLDGVATPWGLVTVMTTNRVEVLDDALTRSGRVDRDEYFGPLDDDQLLELAQLVAGRSVVLPPLGDQTITPADAVGAMKAHIGDPDSMLTSLRQLIATTTAPEVPHQEPVVKIPPFAWPGRR
jgi:hypothetical protein